jgi:histidinol-phosphate aminotransferase
MKFKNPFLDQLSPYSPGEQPKTKNYIKLNTNENPFPPSKKVINALEKFDFNELRKYPDPDSTKLKELLGQKFSLHVDNFFIGNGSDEVLSLIFLGFFRGKKILFPDITYSFYGSFAKLALSKFETIPLEKDFSIDLEKYNKNVYGIIFPNPNAPTGVSINYNKIKSFIRYHSDKLIIIDEAYADFNSFNCTDLVKKFRNLIIVRTFSKSYSLAGLRIGFCLASKSIIKQIIKVKNSFNSYPVDQLAEIAAINAVRDYSYFNAIIEKIKKNRVWLEKKFIEMGYNFIKSDANFILLKPKKISAKNLYLYLRSKGILVRYFPNPKKLSSYIRITIGNFDECQKLVNFLKINDGDYFEKN